MALLEGTADPHVRVCDLPITVEIVLPRSEGGR
jgi:hypothetical protein